MKFSLVLLPVIAAMSSLVAAEPIAAGDVDAPVAPSEPMEDILRRHLPEHGMLEARRSHHNSDDNNSTNSSSTMLQPRHWVSLVRPRPLCGPRAVTDVFALGWIHGRRRLPHQLIHGDVVFPAAREDARANPVGKSDETQELFQRRCQDGTSYTQSSRESAIDTG